MSLPQEIIRRKRDGYRLSSGEIEEFFLGFRTGSVADYQMGAMLMAIYLKGMDFEETAALTKLMRDGGKVLSWDFPPERVVDKHSTGGIGDKTSLIIMPLATLEGLRVPMMAGRGLGHTGGTLDKLEAINGMTVYLPVDELMAIGEKYGGVFMGQTEEIAPIDKRLYSLRDVTGTIESIPLITASILSKKLAEGLGGLVMDVKFGSGAFMSKKDDALELAKMIAGVAKECGLALRVLLTSMNSPLGTSAGNALEVAECIDVMQGKGPDSTRELVIELTAEMVKLAYPSRDMATIRRSLESHLDSGKVFEKFCQIIGAQKGDVSQLRDTSKLPAARLKVPVFADVSGCQSGSPLKVSSINVRDLGLAVQELGGGRRLVADAIDPAVGLSGLKRVGDSLEVGEPIAIVHANDEAKCSIACKIVEKAYGIADECGEDPLIWMRL